jgi:SAM-dependent methyltransferase
MAILEGIHPGAEILELGSNPYFLTRLLRQRGLNVTSANYFGDHHPDGPASQEATRASDGQTERFEYNHFNIEAGAFPYEASTFDVVLFCEILEHLPFDPINALGEIHRVLRKESGLLLITTPNAVRAGNVARILRGENVYESLSGYGAYGRHNREYTLDELRSLLGANGFEMVQGFTADVHAHDEHSMPSASFIAPADRGDNLFCLVRAVTPDKWHYPDWLFTSKPALYGRRIVADSVVVGTNDDLQSSGLYPIENGEHGQFRWTGAAPVKVITRKNAGGRGRLAVEALLPIPNEIPTPELVCRLGGQEVRCRAPNRGEPFVCDFEFTADAGLHEVELAVSTTWCPAESGHGRDTRRLGVGFISVAWR